MNPKQSFLGRKWRVNVTSREGELIERLLFARGVRDVSARARFLTPDLEAHTHTPELLKDLPRAVERILHAIEKRERILVCGDYDVDGVTASAILFETLKVLGANVSVRLPHRVRDGYGLNPRMIEEAHALDVKLIITVDNGISATPAVTRANEFGIDVIITDHHLPPAILPPAFAIIDPRQPGCAYPYKHLSGAGVAYKLALALLKSRVESRESRVSEGELKNELLALVALGTIADVCPLTDENRVLVTHGLAALSATRNPGLLRLMENAGIGGREARGERREKFTLTSEDVGFRLAPRLNAAGRIDSALLSFHALTHPTRALAFADQLEALNRERQQLTEKILQAAEGKLSAAFAAPDSKILLASGEGWHAGVIGLVAGKLAEKFYRPVILMEERGDICVGSCRSPEEFNITEALTEVSDLLTSFGGHRSAAGFTLPRSHRAEFEKRLTALAEAKISTTLAPTLALESVITEPEIQLENVRALRVLAPFGAENPEPLFLLEDFAITNVAVVGANDRHLKLKLGRGNIPAIGFNLGSAASKLHEKKSADVAVTLEENVWNGTSSAQLKIVDLRF